LLILETHKKDEKWLFPRAKELFDIAFEKSWDHEYGGLFYTLKPLTYEVCDDDKYYWVHAEAIIAAAFLYLRSEDEKYREWYKKITEYSLKYFIDPKYHAWYRILNRKN